MRARPTWLLVVSLVLSSLLFVGWLLSPRVGRAVPGYRYVAATGSDGANVCTSPATPCATIQHAVDVATAGDLIRVAGGTYSRPGTVAAVTKTLGIEGGYGQDFGVLDPELYPTLLDAQRQGSVITATNVGDLWLHHLILTRGDGTGNCLNGCGGGIYAENSELRVGYTTISDSVANASGSGWGQGGGIYARNCPFVHIWHSRIVANHAALPSTNVGEGDGIYVFGGVVRIESSEIVSNTGAAGQGSGLSLNYLDALELMTNTIRANHTTRAGGGLFLSRVQHLEMIDNVVEGNISDGLTGGGMWLVGVSGEISRNVVKDSGNASGAGSFGVDIYSSGPLTLTNNLITGNWYGISVLGNSQAGSHVVLANNTIVDNGPVGIQVMYTTTLAITNTLVAGHDLGLRLGTPFSGAIGLQTSLFWNEGGDPGSAIKADPDLGPSALPRLGSPALDAGTTLAWLPIDVRGRPRPLGSGYDIGAYEGTAASVFLPVLMEGALLR